MKQLNYKLAFGLLALTAVNSLVRGENSERVSYENYHVYQLQPKTIAELAVVKTLEDSRDAYIFLDAVHYVNSKMHIIVAPQEVPKFRETIEKAGISFKLLEENAQAKLENERIADSNRRTTNYSWEEYHELNDTYNWLHTLTAKYPQQVSVFEAGRTYEGRQILALKISYGTDRQSVFIEGGMHAREWISPATTTYIANQLLSSPNKDVRNIAEKFDWYIVPHANPDGFVYTHTSDRLWRKTRKPYGNGCFGADPNRNWGFHWNEVGASSKPCSDTYAGPAAFSEVETRTLSDYISTLKGKLFLYVSFHSYSQLLLFPYGHTKELPPNYKDLKRVFDRAIAAMQKRYGTRYTGGNIYDAIYPASGASVDWAYGEVDVKYSYCYELRPSGNSLWTGFRLPANQIIPTGEETLDSLLVMVKEASDEKLL